MHPSIAQQSLEAVSALALELWQQLDQSDDPAEEQRILDEIWLNEANRRAAIDSFVKLSTQIDAELDAIKARRQHLIAIHDAAIARLERWQSQLNQSVLRSNENNLIGMHASGDEHEIEIRLNPPRCDRLTLPIEEINRRYVRKKTIIELDKKAVLADWKESIPVKGVEVVRDRKVVYKLTATNREHLKLKSAKTHNRAKSKSKQ